MSVAQVCPVCQGRGTVPEGFYRGVNQEETTGGIPQEPCRSCIAGVVYAPSPFVFFPPPISGGGSPPLVKTDVNGTP